MCFLVGTWTYNSKVSKQKEHLPIAAGLMATEGFDRELLQLVEAFVESSVDLAKAVQAGRELWELDVEVVNKKLHAPSYNLEESQDL